MAQSAKYLGSAIGLTNAIAKTYPVADGVTVHEGDFVALESGRVTNSGIAGKRLLGMVLGKDTDVSDHSTDREATGDSDGTVQVTVVVDPYAHYLVKNDNDGATFDEDSIGDYFDLTGGAGEQLVDTSTGGSDAAQLLAVDYNPYEHANLDDNEDYGVFMIAEHKFRR